MARYKSWDQIRGELALTDDDLAAYDRLDEAELRLYEARRRRGVTDAAMAQALGIHKSLTRSVAHGDEDLYLFALARFVAAAGGHLEIRAVFADEEVVLLSDLDPSLDTADRRGMSTDVTQVDIPRAQTVNDMARTRSWDETRIELGLSDDDLVGYARLDEAERRLYEARRRRGITDAAMAQALGIDEHRTWSVDHDDDLYLFTLARYVAAAGGRLELRAVFDDEEVVLLSDPEPAGPARPL